MSDKTTRRNFLGTTGAAAASFGMFNILGSRSSRAEFAPQNANDSPVLALIGCGGMGRANMSNFLGKKVPIAAVCDVDARHMGEAADDVEKKQGKRPKEFKDFRELLEQKDIDAVIIGTPDHWHALPLIHACQAEKDAYCEKPISHDIVEARTMAAAAKKHERIVQVGTWQRSTKEFVDAVDYIRSGRLGKVVVARAWKTDNNQLGNNERKDPPSELDYDFWVGPAEMMPYTDRDCHYNWRWFFNYAAGMVGDWGVHMMDIALLGMSPNTDLPMPSKISAYGGKLAYPDDDRTTPDTLLAIYEFPGWVLQWETNRKPLDEGPDHGTEFIAADGSSLMVWRGGWWVKGPDGKEREKTEAPGFDGQYDHWQNFLDCVKSREQPRSNIASMYQTTTVCHLANVAYLAGQSIGWDKEKNDIIGSAGKDTQSYRREYRKPWELPEIS